MNMIQNSFWEEGTKNQWFFCAQDNSSLDRLQEKVPIDLIYFSSNDEPINLGIKRINGRVYSSNYVGFCRLIGVNGKRLLSYDGHEVIIRIEPRFNVSVVEMLNAVRDDDEFERYLAPQTTRMNAADIEIEDLKNNELFNFFNNEDPIFVKSNIAINCSIITATVFLTMLKDLCGRPLMGRMISKEENLTGKIKGKILFRNNIRLNTLRGRDDRIFCKYLRYSEDIIENQTLKVALHKASLFLNKYFGSASGDKNSFRDMVVYCQKALSQVSSTNISRNDLNKIKTTGCYAYYKPVISAAKMVINEISIEAGGGSAFTSYVIPYAVSMEKLFEMYVRAYLKRAGVKSYLSSAPGLHMEKYDYKAKVLANRGNAYSDYISGAIKPDIILYDTESKKHLVFDVKYKNHQNSSSARSDRLQILAYALMHDCDNVGIIFPTQRDDKNIFYKANEIQSQEQRKRDYHQVEVAIDKESSFEIHSAESDYSCHFLDYLISLIHGKD